MAITVDEELVGTMMEVCAQTSEEDREVFREALRIHQNNGEAVVTEFYNDPVAFKQKHNAHKWDEAAFAADRDGSTNPGFQIQGPDQLGDTEPWSGLGGLTAPSRPPSRANNRSPSNPAGSWASGNALSAPTTQQQAEEQFQQAMVASMKQASGSATPQESGVITNGNVTLQQFGPANRPHYREDEWAMVRASNTSADPPAPARQRDPNVPVFLACRLPQRHSVGPLLMMLYEIPAARNFFQLLYGSSPSYGNNKEWWRGSNITTTSTHAQSWGSSDPEVSLVDELQRLVAFLARSDRAYGTADSLIASPPIRESSSWADPIIKLYETLYNSSTSQEMIRMWTKAKVEESFQDVRPQEFAILEFKIANDTPEVFRNLYSQWDYIFWMHPENSWVDRQDEEDLSHIATIQAPAQVMAMRISTDGLPIEVPEVIYIDRYLERNVEAARIMQKKMSHMWKALEKAKEIEEKHTQWKSPDGKSVSRAKLTEAVIEKCESQIWRIRTSALWRMHEELLGTADEIPYLPDELVHLAELNEEEQKAVRHYEAEIALAKVAMAKVDRKLARIRAEKEACCALLHQLTESWTTPSEEPSEDPSRNPTHKYTLRGVITSPDVIYMCRRTKPEIPDEAGTVVDKWYRVAWVAEDDTRVKQESTTIDIVRKAMFTDRNANGGMSPIVVYATEEALNEEPLPLSAALQTFIKFDNRLFKQEQIEDNSQSEKKRVAGNGPQSPPKRQRSDSVDSMATNRASMGDLSDGEDRAALLADQFDDFGGTMATEMSDMRPISEDEIAAHMVPPLTPPLSDGEGSDADSFGLRRSSEKLAELSLEDQAALLEQRQQGAKGPEMEELQQPFIVRRPASALDNRASIIERPMEIDANLEIPGVNPEEYYHQSR